MLLAEVQQCSAQASVTHVKPAQTGSGMCGTAVLLPAAENCWLWKPSCVRSAAKSSSLVGKQAPSLGCSTSN